MSEFPTHAVLSCSTGKLMGDIDGVYAITSFMIGRSAYTHELAFYGTKVAAALTAAHPELPDRDAFAHVNAANVRAVRSEWEAKLGQSFELNEALRDALADESNAIETLKTMKPDADVIVVGPTSQK